MVLVIRSANIIALVAATIFIVYGDARLTGSVFGGGSFVIWDWIPVLVAFLILEYALKRATGSAVARAYVFSTIAVGLTVWCYAAFIWWPPTGPGSSTAPIIFVFLPVYSVIAGSIFGVIVWGLFLFVWRTKPPNQSGERTAGRSVEPP